MKAIKYLFLAVALTASAFAVRPKDEARTVTTPNSDDFFLVDGLTGGTGKLSAPLVVLTNGSYANPSWLPSLAWSKITSTPTTLAGYGITDAAPLVHTHTASQISDSTTAGRALLTAADAAAQKTALALNNVPNTDATLRSNHTGTQLSSTISDFNSAARAQTEAELVAGANITITPASSGATRTLTITASASSGLSDPTTTKGDMLVRSASAVTRFPVGADGTVPIADSTQTLGVRWGSVGGTGTVTSVALSVPSWLTVGGSPVTTTGTLAVTATTGQTANQFLATPNGSTGAVGLRPIVAADVPTLTLSKISDAGTAAALNVPASGNAAAGEVVKGSDTRLTDTRTPTTGTQLQEIGFGVDGGGSVITTGTRVKRVVMHACTITGWGIVADQSGSITMDIRKGTPSGGTVTTSSITASATPALSSQQVNTSTTLTGWTTTVAAGDVLELVVTGTPSAVTAANITLKITR